MSFTMSVEYLTDAQNNYMVIEKELLTVVFALNKFRSYLFTHK